MVLNSIWSFVVNRFHDTAWHNGINHILSGMNISFMNVLAQLKDIFMVLVDGSKTKNKFLITFSVWFLLGPLVLQTAIFFRHPTAGKGLLYHTTKTLQKVWHFSPQNFPQNTNFGHH